MSGKAEERGSPGGAGPDTAEERQSLWILATSPTIWAVHFLACYLTAAVWCARFGGRTAALGGARTAVWIYTALALAGIALTGWLAFRRHTLGTATVPHDFDTPEDRTRFLGLAGVLLSALSAVAVVFVALAAVFLGSCR